MYTSTSAHLWTQNKCQNLFKTEGNNVKTIKDIQIIKKTKICKKLNLFLFKISNHNKIITKAETIKKICNNVIN